MTGFAERLAECLAQRESDWADLARRSGIRPASVSDWKTGKTSPENVKALPLIKAARYLGVNPIWLLTGKGPRDANLFAAHEPASPVYEAHWPFEQLDLSRVTSLEQKQLSRLDGAWIHAAQGLGLDLRKQRVA